MPVQFRGGNSFDYIYLGDKDGKLSIQLDRPNSNIFLIYSGFWLIQTLWIRYEFLIAELTEITEIMRKTTSISY